MIFTMGRRREQHWWAVCAGQRSSPDAWGVPVALGVRRGTDSQPGQLLVLARCCIMTRGRNRRANRMAPWERNRLSSQRHALRTSIAVRNTADFFTPARDPSVPAERHRVERGAGPRELPSKEHRMFAAKNRLQ